jgi:CBS domain-containing protein
MASNPQWCLTLDEWKEQFSTWIRIPQPDALLNATIFFDFRPLFGKAELADAMRRHLLIQTNPTRCSCAPWPRTHWMSNHRSARFAIS